MDFNIGDLAVYPGYGVGKVVNIEMKEIMGDSAEFFSIELLENGSKLMVPCDSAVKKGLRHLINENEADKVMDILKGDRTEKEKRLDTQTWNRRYREYMEKIKTGSVFEIAEVLRDLFILQVGKELSFGERKMLETAQGLLIKELSIATNSDETSVSERMENIFDSAVNE